MHIPWYKHPYTHTVRTPRTRHSIASLEHRWILLVGPLAETPLPRSSYQAVRRYHYGTSGSAQPHTAPVGIPQATGTPLQL